MFLTVSDLNKSFGRENALSNVSFSMNAKESLSIIGKSGSGKTTLLKVIAGLLLPERGTIHVGGNDMTPVPPHKRNIVYLYQEALLFPHLNVFENIAFPLRLRKEADDSIDQKTTAMIHSLQLSGHARKMPEQLSGGQKQRVSFGRALIINPLVLLLDEPFGNLDAGTREDMQQFLKDVAKQFEITSIFVTHDLKEAILMGSRIGFMEKGSVEVFENIERFVQDPRTGVLKEAGFWKDLIEKQNE